MEVRILRLDESFPSGTEGSSLAPHTSLLPLLNLVDEQSRLDIQKLRFLDDARRCLLGRLLARFVLADRANVSHQSLTFEKAPQGRPYATHQAFQTFPFDYNVSHDSDLVAIVTIAKSASVDRRIGIDTMRIRNPWEGTTVDEFVRGIADQLTTAEQSRLDALQLKEAKLHHALALWTLKEAYVKTTGEGLHCDLSQLDFDLDLSKTSEGFVGSASFRGKRLTEWNFHLVRLQEGSEQYFIAVAADTRENGEGSIRFSESKPEWLQFLGFNEIVDTLRNDTVT